MPCKVIILLTLVTLLFSPSASFARYQIDLRPSISVRDLYDDNIDLVRTNEKSEYIMTISPSFETNIVSERNNTLFQYSPTLVRYKNEDQNDTIRQSATLTFGEDLTRRLRFELADTYLRSEEPIESTEGIIGVREGRSIYHRNTGRASMQYIFGPENLLSFGYNHSLMENEDIALDDGTIFDPFFSLTHWVNVNNGFELNSSYTIANFTRDDDRIPGDDYSGNAQGVRYIYRFNPHTSGSVGYNFTNRNFKGSSEDYDIHQGSIGYNHAFSERFSLAVSLGGFVQKNDFSQESIGYTYNVLFNKGIDRGSVSIALNSGWDEAFLEAERRGFTKYNGIDATFTYQVVERISNYAGISYRRDEDSSNRKTKNTSVNYGWRFIVNNWYSVALDYSCSSRDDDLNAGDYIVNRVTLNLMASKLFRY